MSNFVNKLKDYISQNWSNSNQNSNSKTEGVMKEEEDPHTHKFTYDISIATKSTDLNNDSQINELEALICRSIQGYNTKTREIDFLYDSITKGKSQEAIDDPAKMMAIGKIFCSQNSKLTQHFGNFLVSLNETKLESNSNFPTAKSKNCVFKGKWIYEVRLITNGLFQIGWVSNLIIFS